MHYVKPFACQSNFLEYCCCFNSLKSPLQLLKIYTFLFLYIHLDYMCYMCAFKNSACEHMQKYIHMFTYTHVYTHTYYVCEWKFPIVTQHGITHKDWPWISNLGQCFQSLWLFVAWPLNLVVGLNPLLQVAALFLMADCHAGPLLLPSAVQSHATGLKLCSGSVFKCVFSPWCLSLVCSNKLTRCQLLTDPTVPESVELVKGH